MMLCGQSEENMPELPDLMTAEEVAEYLRIDLTTTREMLREGKLPGRKVGRAWRVLRDELEAWLRQPEPVGDGEAEK